MKKLNRIIDNLVFKYLGHKIWERLNKKRLEALFNSPKAEMIYVRKD